MVLSKGNSSQLFFLLFDVSVVEERLLFVAGGIPVI
jgi:hypothetical protein